MAKIKITEQLVGYIDNVSGDHFLNVNTKFLSECISFLNKNRNYGVHISTVSGYEGSNLDFLSSCPWLEKVVIQEDSCDLQKLKILTNLKMLKLYDSSWGNFSCFPKLECFYGSIASGFETFHCHAMLKSVTLTKLKTLTKDCQNLFPASIEEIIIMKGNLVSLSGVEKLSLLRKVDLAYLPNLQDDPYRQLRTVN